MELKKISNVDNFNIILTMNIEESLKNALIKVEKLLN